MPAPPGTDVILRRVGLLNKRSVGLHAAGHLDLEIAVLGLQLPAVGRPFADHGHIRADHALLRRLCICAGGRVGLLPQPRRRPGGLRVGQSQLFFQRMDVHLLLLHDLFEILQPIDHVGMGRWRRNSCAATKAGWSRPSEEARTTSTLVAPGSSECADRALDDQRHQECRKDGPDRNRTLTSPPFQTEHSRSARMPGLQDVPRTI